MKPKAIILKTDGVNRDEDLAFAFSMAGADTKVVHVNDLKQKKENLSNYKILGLPGGFSYGDDIVSGKIMATEMTSFFSSELKSFIIRKNTAILGVCNGFQVLVRTGLLPFGNIGQMNATLVENEKGRFESRWVRVKAENNSKSLFAKNLEDQVIWYPVAHGEGRFFANPNVLEKIEKENLVAFRYVDEDGKKTQKYPDNPNGSINSIVGLSDRSGRILGLMPHPECFVRIEQHPNWRRGKIKTAQGLPLFKNIVEFAKIS